MERVFLIRGYARSGYSLLGMIALLSSTRRYFLIPYTALISYIYPLGDGIKLRRKNGSLYIYTNCTPVGFPDNTEPGAIGIGSPNLANIVGCRWAGIRSPGITIIIINRSFHSLSVPCFCIRSCTH